MTVPPFMRQFVIAISPQLAAFSVGGAVTFPTLLIDQLRADNNTSVHLDIATKSWIGSIYGLAGIPAILMPIVTQKVGRKFGYIITCMFIIIGWILAYTARSAAAILLSESFLGLGTNSLLPISCLGMSEMLAPNYRFVAMQVFGLIQVVGMATGGIFGRFLHFRTVSVIMFVPIVVAMLIALLWPESPSWLAWKGEFDKCEEAFLWLRGNDDTSKKELTELIVAQKENLSRTKKRMTLTALWRKVSSRDFYMPSIHTYLLLNMLYWSGGDVILINFTELVERSTNNKNAAFNAIIVMYAIDLIGSFITNVLIRRFENKTVLLASTGGVSLCLLSSCLITGLQSAGVMSAESLLCMYSLLGFMTFNSLGLNAIVFFIGVELMPVKHRNIGGALYIVCNCGLYASSMKIAPYLILYIDMWGTFMVYALNAVVCALLVWRFIPETKGRTLQEIEDFYANGMFIQRNIDAKSNTPLNVECQ